MKHQKLQMIKPFQNLIKHRVDSSVLLRAHHGHGTFNLIVYSPLISNFNQSSSKFSTTAVVRNPSDQQANYLDDDETHRAGVRIEGPWQVHVLGALPLRSISRLYGSLNSYTLPVWFRVPGYKIYSWLFGVNLDEIEVQDLRQFTSLNDFFLRRLRPEVRPIDEHSILVSPSDGRVVNFGMIEGRRVASVKGMSAIDALLVGDPKRRSSLSSSKTLDQKNRSNHQESLVSDSEFANINDISYSVDQLVGSQTQSDSRSLRGDSGTQQSKVMTDFVEGELERLPREKHKMFFFVVYLAPGDYHRFHSPTDWLERELFSVSPWMVGKLADLFVLNERVALLGRWTHGFFSMTPVGATNVGSIIINFDKDLKTNSPHYYKNYKDEVYQEALYFNTIKGSINDDDGGNEGKRVCKGEEIGGFSLGSTIVLVFEAPENFEFVIKKGESVKFGQRIGNLKE
ncbi:phosphatidylserine decarboxylase-domain-containing protein [Phakopsora pachyrhizi]|nr:phosphatidylserine decarboxylase-domain-containing protein [Phakopsora pachyrhizi]